MTSPNCKVQTLQTITREFLLNNITKVGKLNLDADSKSELWSFLKNAEKLSDEHIPLFLDDEYLSVVDFGVPWKRTNVSDQALLEFAKKAKLKGGTRWTKLSLEGCKAVSSSVDSLIELCPSTLKHLDLRRTNVQPSSYYQIAKLPKLRHLFCNGNISDPIANLLSTHLVYLVELWLGSSPNLTPTGVEMIVTRCNKLEALFLDHLKIFGDEQLTVTMSHSLPKLRILSMRYLERAESKELEREVDGDSFIRPILWGCTKLEVLDISHLPSFTGVSFSPPLPIDDEDDPMEIENLSSKMEEEFQSFQICSPSSRTGQLYFKPPPISDGQRMMHLVDHSVPIPYGTDDEDDEEDESDHEKKEVPHHISNHLLKKCRKVKGVSTWRKVLVSPANSPSMMHSESPTSSKTSKTRTKLDHLLQLNLQGTSIEDSHLGTILQVCPSLTCLNIVSCEKLQFSSSLSVWDQPNRLKKLELSDSAIGFEQALAHCPHLEQISCYLPAENSHQCSFDTIQCSSSLTKLSLIFCFQLGNLDKLVRSLPSLTCLDLCDVSGVSQDLLLAIAKSCPYLESLNLSNSTFDPEINWPIILGHFKQLSELCVLNCQLPNFDHSSSIKIHK